MARLIHPSATLHPTVAGCSSTRGGFAWMAGCLSSVGWELSVGADIDKACVTASGVLYFFLLYQAEALFVESVILNHSSQLPRSERLIIH